MVATIDLTDIGPVESLTIPVPEDGGVVVLRGANGSGKSSTLRAVDRLATGKKTIDISARDGAPRGEIRGCGVTVKVGRSISRTGELEVESLDGRLSVAELVDPGLKGADEADGRRIRALVQLAGVKPDVELFAGLFDSPAEFAEITKAAPLETDDILILADRIKRAIEAAARNAEGAANQEKAKAAACREAAAGVSTDVVTDEKLLGATLEEAVRRDSTLREQARAAEARAAEIFEARQRIDAAKAESGAMEPQAVREKLSIAEANHQSCLAEHERLRAELAKAEINLRHAASDLSHWRDRLKDSESFADMIAELQETVAAGELPAPTETELEEAAEAVMDARESIEAGAIARRAIEEQGREKQHAARAELASRRADSLREAAKRVDDVLSEQIATLGVPLEVRAGRLVTKSRRGLTPFSELSEGERWRMALDIAIEAVGPRGLLSIPQVAWEGLDPDNRRLIREHVKGRGAVILTAEATDGPLRAEIDE